LGITGGVGSGKSRVLEILKEEYGFRVIQADQVAKKLMEPGQESYRAVVDCLGPSILNEDGTINRPAMAGVIFGCPEKRSQVDRLTHPLVWKTAFREALDCPEPLVVIEAAVPSKEFRDNCREMWYVYTSRENRTARLRESRGYTKEKTESIMDSQASESGFRAFSDAVIDNNGSVEETGNQIRQLLKNKIRMQ
jgi:dephospho-CoA kinase